MEQNLNSFSALSANNSKKKISKTKLILIIIGSIIGAIILLIVIHRIDYKVRCINRLKRSVEAGYAISQGCLDGARNSAYKELTVDGMSVTLSMSIPSEPKYSTGVTLSLDDPVTYLGTEYELFVSYSPYAYLWGDSYFAGISYESGGAYYSGYDIDSEGKLTTDEYKESTAEELSRYRELKSYYLSLLNALKNEYAYIMKTYK